MKKITQQEKSNSWPDRDGCKILTRLAKRQCCKCCGVVSSGAKNISHADRVFYHKIQRDFQKHQNKAHNRKRVKGVAGRAKHEILARVVEFCVMVCHHGLWYFTGHFVGQWNAAEFSAKSLFPVPRLFHDKKYSLQDGWHSNRERFSRGPKFSETNSKYDLPSTREFAPSSK